MGQGPVIPWITLSILYIGIYARVLRSSLIDARTRTTSARRARRVSRSGGYFSARAAHFDDLVRQPLRSRLRRARRRRRAADRGRLRAPRGRAAHLQSLGNLDLPLIMGSVIYGAFFVVLANAVVDVPTPGSIRGSASCLMPPTSRCSRSRPAVSFRTEAASCKAVDGLSFTLDAGRGARHRRRVGLGQERHDVVADAAHRDPNAVDRRRGALQGPRPLARARTRCGRSAATRSR